MDRKSEDLTISKIVRLPKLRVYDAVLAAYEETHPYTNLYPVIDRNTYLGIEVEVENVMRYDNTSPYWQYTDDGSLRNRGKEFITPPIKAWRVEHALHILLNKDTNPDIDFSERTSIHVHMNIRTLTLKQLEALVVTYLVFERAMFSFVGSNRSENIFCVPVTDTTIGENLFTLLEDSNPNITWEKYTALNLLPIMQKGTVEFRHLAGTRDIKRIMTWINLILCLKKFALQKNPQYIWERVGSLNTTSEYRLFAEEVFGSLMLELWSDTFNKEVAQGVTYVKVNCINNEFEDFLYENRKKPEPIRYEEPTPEIVRMLGFGSTGTIRPNEWVNTTPRSPGMGDALDLSEEAVSATAERIRMAQFNTAVQIRTAEQMEMITNFTSTDLNF